MSAVIFYTDGSCLKNGSQENTGGFGVLGLDKDEKIVVSYSKRSENTTNNREELKAILYVLKNYGNDPNNIPTVYSDSAYSVNTLTNWMYNWSYNNWIKSDGKTPENLDIIQEYYDLCNKGYQINLQKVKGHSTNKWNNLVDNLATGKIEAWEVINGTNN